MRILAISSAYGGARAAVLDGDAIVAEGVIAEEMGLAAALPVMVDGMLDRVGRGLGLVAVVVGPGSFTGLRAGISLAAGVSLGLSIPLVAVGTGEALAAGLPPLPGRVLWTAIHARTGRIFLDRGDGFAGMSVGEIPAVRGAVAVCGNAAAAVAAGLAARGGDVMLTDARVVDPRFVAVVALRRVAGELPALEALPVYVDAPEARLPRDGLRPAPV